MTFKKRVDLTTLKYASIDFEFFGTNNYKPNLVCSSISLSDTEEIIEHWLLDDTSTQDHLVSTLKRLHSEGYHLLAFAAIAEARSILALGDDPLEYLWFDDYCEWLCLKNHNNQLGYGKQLIKGMKKYTVPPKNKYQQTEEDKGKANGSKAENNLAAFLYKMLGVVVDTAHKTKMRDIIISGDRDLINENREAIQAYCTSDVKYLYPATMKAVSFYKKYYSPEDYRKLYKEMLYRGEYSVRTALVEQEGYGIDYEATKNFSDSTKYTIEECQREILALFPETPIFKWIKKDLRFGVDTKVVRDYIRTLGEDVVSKWELTDTGMLSLKLAAFKNVFDFRHDYPEDILGAQIVRYLVLQQNLNGFKPTNGKKKKTFWDSVGSDQRVRPFLGIYGSQSARNQPSATGFLFLKSAWMRALCKPPEGYMYVGIDYGSEEFLVGALLSGDMNMINAYHSGDPYLYFGKAAKAIPEEGTKQSHPFLRDKFKSTTLGIQYLMAKYSLANKLTLDTGIPHTVPEAEALIDLFDNVFFDYSDYRKDIVQVYREDGYLKLTDGWTMFKDNINFRSVANMPVQGTASVILRNMVKYLQEAGLTVVKTLHDAGYCKIKLNDWKSVDLMADCMQRAFVDTMSEVIPKRLEKFNHIRLDTNAWGEGIDLNPDLKTPEGMPVKCQEVYVDGRGIAQYEKFSKYFNISLADMEKAL